MRLPPPRASTAATTFPLRYVARVDVASLHWLYEGNILFCARCGIFHVLPLPYSYHIWYFKKYLFFTKVFFRQAMQELLAGVAALAPPDALERLQSGRSTLIAELPAIHAALRSASAVQQEELATCAVADNPEQGRLLVRAIASIDTADVAALALSASQTSTTATVSPLCALHDAEVMGAVHRIFVSLPADAKAKVCPCPAT